MAAGEPFGACSSANELRSLFPATIRLINGSGQCSGRVEFHHQGHWWSVFNAQWGLHEAAVVCREMNCGDPVKAAASFGQSADVGGYKVSCNGRETSLAECSLLEDVPSGHHRVEAAAVQCSGTFFPHIECFVSLSLRPRRKTRMRRSPRLRVSHRQREIGRRSPPLRRQGGVLRQRPLGGPVRRKVGQQRRGRGVQAAELRQGPQDHRRHRVRPRLGAHVDRADRVRWDRVHLGPVPAKFLPGEIVQHHVARRRHLLRSPQTSAV